MFALSPTVRIFVCTRYVDMRMGFDGLFGKVQTLIQQDPYSGALFLFRSRRGHFIKVLWWDLDGWALFAKRLDKGTFEFPDIQFEDGKCLPVEIDRANLMMLLEGIDARSAKRQKRYRHKRRDQDVISTPKVPPRTPHGPKRPTPGK